MKGPRYPGACPWTTLYVNTAILNSNLSGTRSQWRQASASEMWSNRDRCGPSAIAEILLVDVVVRNI